MDSHRLVLWAQGLQPGKGEELAHSIGLRYFEQAVPLANRTMLIDAAEQVGLDRAAAQAYLQSDSGFDDVSRSVSEAHSEGLHSIPVFVFASGEFVETVHGSANVERFSHILQAIKRHWNALTLGTEVAGTSGAEACS
jgi:predicted DsbA family dithiol-disulfide isomerase